MDGSTRLMPTLRDSAILWWGLVMWLVLSIAVLTPIAPNDYWWYARVGRDTLRDGAVPVVDTLSYTQAGKPVAYHSWLSAVLFYLLRQWGGDGLTVLVKAVLLAVFYTCIWLACRLMGAGPRLSSLMTLPAALAGSNNWAVRPQLVAYPLFGITLIILLGKPSKIVSLWALPALMALWVNLHGSFVLGFLLVGAAWVGQKDRRLEWGIALFSMAAATLINPRGWGAWNYVLTLLGDPSSQRLGTEWRAPAPDTWQNILFFGWLLSLAPLVFWQARRGHERLPSFSWMHGVWFLGFGWMALSGLRYVIWFIAILTPLTAGLLSGLVGRRLDRGERRGPPAFHAALLSMLCLMPLAWLPGLRERWWVAAPPALTRNTPVAAARWLAAHPELPGPLWSDIAFASYFTYALPERPVWSDTRFEVYPLEQSLRYIEISRASYNWQEFLDGEGVRLLVLDPHTQPRLLEAAQASLRWEVCYQDDVAVILTRRPFD